MNPIESISTNKQLLTTVAIASVAFLLALPIGATLMPKTSAMSSESPAEKIVAATVCAEDTSSATGAVQSATTKQAGSGAGGTNTRTHTHTHTTTQTSSNNSGSTAQVGRDGIAAAVTVGDVLSNNDILSNNDVSVPVLSNNTTTVSPSVNLLNSASILNHNKGTLLDLDLL